MPYGYEGDTADHRKPLLVEELEKNHGSYELQAMLTKRNIGGANSQHRWSTSTVVSGNTDASAQVT